MARPFFLFLVLSLAGVAQGFGAEISMGPIRQWVQTLGHPNVAYLLLVLGFYALVYEFSTPGIGLGGISGVLCLILAFFSLHALPLNFAGLALLLAGMTLMGLEALLGFHGIFILAGLISLTFGSFFLFDRDQAVVRVSLELILAIVVTSAVFFGSVVRKIWVLRRRPPVTGREGLVGQRAEVRPGGLVFVEGALWTVEGGLEGCAQGDWVRVVKLSGNRLIVQKED